MLKQNSENKFKSEFFSSKIRNFLAVSFIFIKMFGSAFLIYFGLNKLIYGLQKYFYQKPGEILVGTGKTIIPALFLICGITYFLLLLETKFEQTYFPRFYKYMNVEGPVEFKGKFIKKLNRFLIMLIPLGIFFIYLLFHEYIVLGNNCIAASSASLFSNRKDYSYSEIKIEKELHRNGSVESWVYIYSFPDGKSTSNIWDGFGITDEIFINMVKGRQKVLGLPESTVGIWEPRQKNEAKSKMLTYLGFGVSYFLFAWFFSRIMQVKKKKKK